MLLHNAVAIKDHTQQDQSIWAINVVNYLSCDFMPQYANFGGKEELKKLN